MTPSSDLSSTWRFAQNLAKERSPTVGLDASQDYLIFDNPVTVRYAQEGSQVLQRDGRVAAQRTEVVVNHAGRYRFTERDLLADAAGHLKVGDLRVELPKDELDGLAPASGDRATFDDGAYVVLAVDYDELTHMYIAWCRK